MAKIQSRLGGGIELETIEAPWRANFENRLRRAKDYGAPPLNATDRVMLVRPQHNDLFARYKSMPPRLPVQSIYDPTPEQYLIAAWKVASPAQRQSFREWIATQLDDEGPVSPIMRELARKDEDVALAVQLREQALGTPAKHHGTGHVTALPRPPSPVALIAEMARRGLPGAAEGRKAARVARDAARAPARKAKLSDTPPKAARP